MIKHLFLFILCSFVFCAALAQKKDTTVYYLQRSGKVVSIKDSADFLLMISPPDTSVGKRLFVVKEYTVGGRLIMNGYALNKDIKLKYQGDKIFYYPNGKKMKVEHNNDGKIDFENEYYANGMFYNTKKFETNTEPGKPHGPYLLTCNDSLGNVLTANGNGEWIEYNIYSCKTIGRGAIVDGSRNGLWSFTPSYTINLLTEYKNDRAVKCTNINEQGVETEVNTTQVPEFAGGIEGFNQYIKNNLTYPVEARKNNKQGRVIISFIIECDGSVTNVRVERGIDSSLDEEAERVIKASPKWKEGVQNGMPVRCAYTVPITFIL
jgi:TonB family protein